MLEKEIHMLTRYALSDNVDRWVSHDGGTIKFSGNTMSGRPFEIVTYLNDANRWANGECIQTCFPYLSSEEREILITGHDDESWALLFGEAE